MYMTWKMDEHVMWVKQCYKPSRKSQSLSVRINQSQVGVVYDIVLPTLHDVENPGDA